MAKGRIEKEYAAQLRNRGYSESEIRRTISARPPRGATTSPKRPPSIITAHSGRQLDIANPSPNAINADDIAHGLAAICRFAGQTRDFYSVAQHSLMVASLVPARLHKHALLHDAGETYLQDLPTPVKALLPGYRIIEDAVTAAIDTALNLAVLSDEDRAIIKRADMIAVNVEMRDLFAPGHFDRRALPTIPDGLHIHTAWLPAHAKQQFLAALAL